MWSGKEHADPSRSAAADPIFAPTLSLIGMSTPTTFYNGLTEEALSDGFLERLTVVHTKTMPNRQEAPAQQIIPPTLIAAIKNALAVIPAKCLAAANAHNHAIKPYLYEVEWESNATMKKFLAIEDWPIE